MTYGELVVVSGQCAVDAAGSVLADASALEQAKQVFRNVDLALQAAGSSHRGILKLSTYVVSLEDLPAVRAARDEWLGNCRPASTLVQVAGLVDSALLVEVDVLAVRTRA